MEEEMETSYDDLLQEVQQQFLSYKEKADKRFMELENLIGKAAQTMEILKKKVQRRRLTRSNNPIAKVLHIETSEDTKRPLTHLKLSFPKFNGSYGVSEWIQDCEQYFSVYKIEDAKKVAVAGLHLEGVTRSWFQTYTLGRKSVDWPEFCQQFTARFGAWEQELLYENFKQLQQNSTMDLYYNQFEKYQEQLKEKMPFLTEAFFVECFSGGIQNNSKETLRLLNPTTVLQAFKLAKQCTESEEAEKKLCKKNEASVSKQGSFIKNGQVASLQSVVKKPRQTEGII